MAIKGGGINGVNHVVRYVGPGLHDYHLLKSKGKWCLFSCFWEFVSLKANVKNSTLEFLDQTKSGFDSSAPPVPHPRPLVEVIEEYFTVNAFFCLCCKPNGKRWYVSNIYELQSATFALIQLNFVPLEGGASLYTPWCPVCVRPQLRLFSSEQSGWEWACFFLVSSRT